MHAAYKVLAFLIVALVAVQAAAHAWASSGLVKYLAQGGTIDFESTEAPPVPEFLGLMIHGMNGMFVIPAVAIGLLILALLTKSSHAIIWAGAVGGLVALQVTFGLLGHETSAFALLHGLNAIVLAGTALAAGILAFRTTGVAATSRAPAAARVA
ncbi:MAG: hypothetical protein QM286_13635 [Acidobacteriota bacterium]|nr:hypothetical protein [Acidobacteriota bacterium]